MTRNTSIIHALTALGLLTGLAGPVAAATVSYQYGGVVNFCDDAALGGGICGVVISIGDTISGEVLIDAPNGVADMIFTPEDVIDFSVGISDGGIGATPENSELEAGSMLITDAAGLVTNGSFSVLVDPQFLPVAINADLAAQTWEILAFPGALDLRVTGGTGGFGAPAAVPLPAGVWLLGSGLMALLGRRRATRPSPSA